MAKRNADGSIEKNQIEIGSRVQMLRKKAGFSREQLSERSNLSVQSICKIESGNRNFRIQSLIAISGALGVSADYILGLSKYSDDDNMMCMLSSLSPKGKEFMLKIMEIYIQMEA